MDTNKELLDALKALHRVVGESGWHSCDPRISERRRRTELLNTARAAIKKAEQPAQEDNMRKIIQLTSNVTNPKPDGRSDQWDKAKVFKAGSHFCTYADPNNNIVLRKPGQMGSMYHRHPAHQLLVDNSIEVPPSTALEMMHVADCDWSCEAVLESAVRLGLLRLDDFEAIANEPDE